MVDPRLRVLVTGVTGQDGGYLAEALAARGHEVHGIVSDPGAPLPRHLLDLGDAFVPHLGDLRDPASITRWVDEVAPEWFVNLGGASSVAASWDDPVGVMDLNARPVLAFLEHLRRSQEAGGRPVRFLQASSAEAFAANAGEPVDEDSPVGPMSPYGVAKAAAHQAVGMYRARGVHASSLVLFNHESPRRPERFVTRKITRGAADIAAGRARELVLGNLDVARDWGWAPDYVAAMVLALEAGEPDDYVVATGQAHTLRDLVSAAFAAVGIHDWSTLVRSDPAFVRPADAAVLVGDATRMRTRLGWAPTVSFEEMVAAMVAEDVRPTGRT